MYLFWHTVVRQAGHISVFAKKTIFLKQVLQALYHQSLGVSIWVTIMLTLYWFPCNRYIDLVYLCIIGQWYAVSTIIRPQDRRASFVRGWRVWTRSVRLLYCLRWATLSHSVQFQGCEIYGAYMRLKLLVFQSIGDRVRYRLPFPKSIYFKDRRINAPLCVVGVLEGQHR
jgi:hypothetical protein